MIRLLDAMTHVSCSRWKKATICVTLAILVCVLILHVNIQDTSASLSLTSSVSDLHVPLDRSHVDLLPSPLHPLYNDTELKPNTPVSRDVTRKLTLLINNNTDDWKSHSSESQSVSNRQSHGMVSANDGKGRAKRLPDCVMVGVPKGGTFTLIHFLGLHPQIVIPKEEVNFFHVEENFSQGYQWYLDKMPYSEPGQITMEKSPRYFYYDHVPGRIWRLRNDIKLLVILRDPIERVLSCYTHRVEHYEHRHMTYDRSPADVILDLDTGEVNSGETCVNTSLYAEHLPRWFKQFPREQILIVDGDLLITDPYLVIHEIEEYLDLPKWFQSHMFKFNKLKGFYCFLGPGKSHEYCMPKSKGRQHPDISGELYQKMINFFRPYNALLQEITKRNFSWFKKYDTNAMNGGLSN